MKNKLLQHSFRKIKTHYKRFLSLLCISLLGVGFFAGIQATSPDMLNTLDSFYDKQNVYDIEIISPLGLTEKDREQIQKLSTIQTVIGSHSKDVILSAKNKEYIFKLIEFSQNMNQPYLLEGKYPSHKNEIVVEKDFLIENQLKIGDTILIQSDSIDNHTFKITGTVISPLYFSTDRGSTPIGNGKIDYYAYTKEDFFKEETYSNLFITVKGARKKITFHRDYESLIQTSIQQIQQIKKKQEEIRYQELYQPIINQLSNQGIEIDYHQFIKPNWYIFDRTNNSGYKNLTDAYLNLKKLGNVFPLVFDIIAILISLISMKRMIEEDRTENGTLKALGFSSLQITLKYILYSLSATVIGGFLGMSIGFILIPNIIWNIYTMLFYIPDFSCSFHSTIGMIGLLIGIICITGTAIFVSYKELKNVPASLMRPKSPKAGKKIILEKITFLWKRLHFSSKITIRNIFRYKGRVGATMIGIAGCTALILAGFGLKDSLKDIANYQFHKIFHYDKMITFKGSADISKFSEMVEKDFPIQDIVMAVMENITLEHQGKKQEVVLLAPSSNQNYEKIISLFDIHHKQTPVRLEENSVIISEKLAHLLDLDVQDTITLKNQKQLPVSLKIKVIVENYVNHYLYMDQKTYEKIYGTFQENTMMLNFSEGNSNFNKMMLKNDSILSIIDSKEVIENVSDMMESLNSVVVILIVAAALLALVVLYNLSNINISERKREIATLKVLGFYHKEVDHYITSENIILTVIGIGIGLYLGSYLGYYIISTCEPDYLMFVRHVNLSSYLYASLITIIFTIIVNIITHFSLKKIDMISSLKNVE